MTTATLIKETFNLGGFHFQKLSPLLSWWETWCHVRRHDAGEGAQSPTS